MSFDLYRDEPASSERPLHIVMVAPPYFDIPPRGYGGVEAIVASLSDELVEQGHRVTLIGAGRDGTAAEFVRVWDDVLTERLGEIYPEVVHAMKVRAVIEDLAANDHIDIVHDHTFAGPSNAPFYRLLGIPTVVTVHGPVEGDMREYYHAFDDGVGLVAISDRQRALAPELPWIGRVHNAIDPEDWPFRTEKKDYALFLGRYADYKGPDRALDAAHAAGIRLILAGKCNEPPEHAYFDEHIRPRLTDNDCVFGEADAIAKRELLAAARCLLFPISWEEPFGIVMIEAMVCGTPVVALRGGAVEEVIEHGVTGFICDHPAELPDAIARAGELDPHACRERVVKRFSLDKLGSGYAEVYRHAIVVAEARARMRGWRGAISLPTSVPDLLPGATETENAVGARP
ncbi:glycosyltransferase [Nocardia sp. ET3-3]|uniref:Glycosyltransferase n=1 Tax=Nocardia terrae TaxID=2675851 RepID=A0A7K1UVI4_9NOCA|nr:glycosyltransferase family 4 protein [Nocardia terrae]MVU78179.1 glycosyltransferase [Nocardia terrae]